VTGLNSNRKKTINLFAIVIVLLVAVPEIVGHSIFEKPHPENSSVVAAITLANKIGISKHASPSCHLTIGEDPSGSKIARVAGLQGQYGNFTCVSP
jgi:methionine-rich copper-binding protein CopC